MKTKHSIDEIYDAIHKENQRYHSSLYEKKNLPQEATAIPTTIPEVSTSSTNRKPKLNKPPAK